MELADNTALVDVVVFLIVVCDCEVVILHLSLIFLGLFASNEEFDCIDKPVVFDGTPSKQNFNPVNVNLPCFEV